MENSKTDIKKCTFCGSEHTKKRFLGLPNVFGFGPVLFGGLVLIGSIIAIGNGLATRARTGYFDIESQTFVQVEAHGWLLQVIIGTIIALLVIVGLIAKNYKCLDCGKGFNWPPPLRTLKVRCPQCATRLKGADSDMLGDKAICKKCNFEFELTEDM